MHWEVLIIPLIALGVWILGTVFRGEEERPSTPIRRGGPGRPTQRRPVTDLDQFLEEARRRREAGQKQAPTQSPRPAAPARPAQPPRRPARERMPAAQTPRPGRPTSRVEQAPPTPASPPEAIPVAELVRPRKDEPAPVFEVTSLPSLSETSLARGVRPTGSAFEVTSLPALSEMGGTKETVAPLTQQLRGLLRQPQSAALAFVLREVLDRPLSRRR